MLARETVRLLEHTQPAASALESKDDSIPAAATGTSEAEDTIQRAETIKMDISSNYDNNDYCCCYYYYYYYYYNCCLIFLVQEYAYAQLLDEIRYDRRSSSRLW